MGNSQKKYNNYIDNDSYQYKRDIIYNQEIIEIKLKPKTNGLFTIKVFFKNNTMITTNYEELALLRDELKPHTNCIIIDKFITYGM